MLVFSHHTAIVSVKDFVENVPDGRDTFLRRCLHFSQPSLDLLCFLRLLIVTDVVIFGTSGRFSPDAAIRRTRNVYRASSMKSGVFGCHIAFSATLSIGAAALLKSRGAPAITVVLGRSAKGVIGCMCRWLTMRILQVLWDWLKHFMALRVPVSFVFEETLRVITLWSFVQGRQASFLAHGLSQCARYKKPRMVRTRQDLNHQIYSKPQTK